MAKQSFLVLRLRYCQYGFEIIKKHRLFMLEKFLLAYKIVSLENLTKEELMTLAKYDYENMSYQQLETILITPLTTKPTSKPAPKP